MVDHPMEIWPRWHSSRSIVHIFQHVVLICLLNIRSTFQYKWKVLNGDKVWVWEDEKALQIHGGDGYTIIWRYLMPVNWTLKKWPKQWSLCYMYFTTIKREKQKLHYQICQIIICLYATDLVFWLDIMPFSMSHMHPSNRSFCGSISTLFLHIETLHNCSGHQEVGTRAIHKDERNKKLITYTEKWS